ncbi:MAG: putative glycosyltransferase [Rhodospirillales bacterium]|jgi:glycosyltransferase involved in cell wall biosynthesis|nr:putative glycosyltransferase [Rhodospirillales bacterium]
MTKVSIIVPVYNEANTIVEILERINAVVVSGVEFEVIVVDDGSRDRTRELVESRPDLWTHFLPLSVNQGKGGAVIAGLAKAGGDYILFQDADLEYDPADYGILLEPVLRFNADVVMGSRFRAPRINRVSYFWHMAGNKCITLLFNVLYNTTFTDVYSCYLLYRRSLIDYAHLRARGWDQHAEILCTAVRSAKALYEVPINYYGRSYEEGKKIRGHHAAAVFLMIIKKRFS